MRYLVKSAYFQCKARLLFIQKNLAYAESILRPLNLCMSKPQRVELLYWLVQSNVSETLADIKKVYKHQQLAKGGKGLLWVIEKLRYRARGIVKTRLEFLYDELQKPQPS